MILTDSFNKDWVLSCKNKIKGSDPSIIERMIWAYYLAENLALSELKFLFKGGTSLALVFDKLRRFSVDIDILTNDTRDNLEKCLNKIVDNSTFIRYELDEKRSYKDGIPKAHYKFFYSSLVNDIEDAVLLDVLFDNFSTTDILRSKIQSELLITEEPIINIVTPTINLFMGDKLTAFAPNTIGIRFGVSKEMEIIKQIFDLNFIFDNITDLQCVLNNYKIFSEKQIIYRSLDIEMKDTLQDTINTALMIAFGRSNVFNNEGDKEKYEEIIMGIRQFKQFSAGGNFTIDSVVLSTAKVAYLSYILLSKLEINFKKYNEDDDIKNYLIQKSDYSKLNKIKAIPGGALYYLNQILK